MQKSVMNKTPESQRRQAVCLTPLSSCAIGTAGVPDSGGCAVCAGASACPSAPGAHRALPSTVHPQREGASALSSARDWGLTGVMTAFEMPPPPEKKRAASSRAISGYVFLKKRMWTLGEERCSPKQHSAPHWTVSQV